MDETDDVTLNFGEEDEIDRRKRLKYVKIMNWSLFNP